MLFAVSVLKEIYDDKSNIVYSPINLYLALKIICAGCKGDTKKQLNSLLSEEEYEHKVDTSDYYTCNALMLLIKDAYDINENFISNTKSLCGINTVTFTCVKQIPGIIKRYISLVSGGSITDINCFTHSDTKSLVINAVSFRSNAIFTAFKKSQLLFYRGDYTTFIIDSITLPPKHYYYSYIRSLKSQVVRIHKDYINMTIILPDSLKDLDYIVETITEDTLNKAINSDFSTKYLKIHLPIFSISYGQNFALPVFNLDCPKLFINSDLTGITNVKDFQISGIIQKTVFDIDFQEINDKYFSKYASDLKVNKPFMFIITDIRNGSAPLLMGTYQGR